MDESEYHNIAQLEDRHWWYVGMSEIAASWLRGLSRQRLFSAADPSASTLRSFASADAGLVYRPDVTLSFA